MYLKQLPCLRTFSNCLESNEVTVLKFVCTIVVVRLVLGHDVSRSTLEINSRWPVLLLPAFCWPSGEIASASPSPTPWVFLYSETNDASRWPNSCRPSPSRSRSRSQKYRRQHKNENELVKIKTTGNYVTEDCKFKFKLKEMHVCIWSTLLSCIRAFINCHCCQRCIL